MIPTKPRVTVQLLEDRHAFVQLNQNTAYITYCLKRPGKGGRLARIEASYFGFDDHHAATTFCQYLQANKLAKRVILRKGQRLETAYEVKVNGIDENLIWELSQQQQSEPTPEAVEPTPEEVIEEVEAIAPVETNDKYLAGDVVEIGSGKHGDSLIWGKNRIRAK